MKRIPKRVTAIILVLSLILCVFSLLKFDVMATQYQVGDTIIFGTYPQSLVTDSSLVESLNLCSKNWISYNYYSGLNGECGTMKINDFMQYSDLYYDGKKYRAVSFSEFRPSSTMIDTGASNSYQDNNGYNINEIYYFKYEPLQWIVLDLNKGLVISKYSIDSQPFSNLLYWDDKNFNNNINAYGEFYNDIDCTVLANDYPTSNIRNWLNKNFFIDAFTSLEQSFIKTSEIDNSCPDDSFFDCETTYDKIFLLSNEEAHKYFTSDSSRITKGTDYAKSQGLYVLNSNQSHWLLRTPWPQSDYYWVTDRLGFTSVDGVTSTGRGVRPALTIDFSQLNKYHIAGRSFDKNIDYYVDTIASSSSYNPQLSNMLAALSADVYSDIDIEKSYKSLGFDDPQFGDYFDCSDPFRCGYVFDLKESDYSNETICLVTVRGSVGSLIGSDWIGNLCFFTVKDEKHTGFSYPAYHIYESIQGLIETRKITGNINYVITGHSRGAAVANLLSVKLMEEGVSSTRIFNYNFACPDVARKQVFPIYNNIFNICNRADIVPYVPGHIVSALESSTVPPGATWGKFGKTYWFTKEVSEIDIVKNHDIKVYLEFTDKQKSPSDWGYSAGDVISDTLYRLTGMIVKVFCPVDVIITDKNRKVVASIVGEEVNYYDDSCGNIIIFSDGDRKIIYVNENMGYNVQLIGNDTGEMTYSVEKYNVITDEVIESKTFTNVKLEDGKTMYSPVSNADTTKDIELLLVDNSNNDNTVTHIIEPDGTENKLFLLVNEPKTRTLYLGDSIRLSVNSNLPNDYRIKWKVDGDGVEIRPSYDGKRCKITSTSTGNVVIKAYVVDSNGNIVTDENGKQISDSEYFYSEADFWLRILYFIRKLFGISMATAQLFKGEI